MSTLKAIIFQMEPLKNVDEYFTRKIWTKIL